MIKVKSVLLKGQEGYALIVVLLVIVLFTVMGMSLMTVTTTSMKNSVSEKDHQSSYYIAENGVKLQMHEINARYASILTQASDFKAFSMANSCNQQEAEECIVKAFEQSVSLGNNKTIQFEEQFSKPTRAVITVVKDTTTSDGVPRYKVISTGMIGSSGDTVESRTVEALFSLELSAGEEGAGISFPSNMAVYTKTVTEMVGGTINGDIVMHSTDARSMQFKGNPTFKGTLYYPQNAKEPYLVTPGAWWDNANKFQKEKKEIVFEARLPDFPVYPTTYPVIPDQKVKIGSKEADLIKNGVVYINDNTNKNAELVLRNNVTVSRIEFNGNTKLTINVGNTDVSMVVDSISGNGHLDVKNTGPQGKLTLYVRGNIETNNHINQSGGEDLLIYIGPSQGSPKTLNRGGSFETNASVYAADANVQINGSASFNGTLITGGELVRMPGKTSGYSKGNVVFAPNARVDLLGSSELRGSVVSKSFHVSGGGKVTATEINEDELPFFEGGERVPPRGSIVPELIVEN